MIVGVVVSVFVGYRYRWRLHVGCGIIFDKKVKMNVMKYGTVKCKWINEIIMIKQRKEEYKRELTRL